MSKSFLRSFFILLLLSSAFIACSTHAPTLRERPDRWAKAVVTKPIVNNLFMVDNHLYRSGQPTKENFVTLYKNLGVRNVLSLRAFHDDKEVMGSLRFHYKRIPINTSKMSYRELVEAVAFILHAKGKTLVHCLHGSDRTGTVVAGYRIAAQGWSKEAATDEFEFGGYGYHSLWFPNLPKLLLTLDEKKFRQDVLHYRK